MNERKAYHIHIEGDSYQVGKTLGQMLLKAGVDLQNIKRPALSAKDEQDIYNLFAEFCPGLNEELAGFAEVLGIPTRQVMFYSLTYLKPGCSQMAVLPSKTANGHTLVARNYEFSDQMEDMTLFTTRIAGKNSHIGSASVLFGRADGMNEWGLAVSQTSAGMPVSSEDFGRKPAIPGLQFWAVIRSLLENCANVDEAIYLAKQMPIAYNINLLVADRQGDAALLESFDGEKAVKRIGSDTNEQCIFSTNHVHLPELKHYEPMSMRNSLIRYDLIKRTLNEKIPINKDDLKNILSTKYPQGLCCHYYDEFFGTLRSMVFDLNDCTLDMCFGSPILNEWFTFNIGAPFSAREYPVRMAREKMPPDFCEMI